MPAAISDLIDLESTAERSILDLAGRGLGPLMALGHYRYLQAYEPLQPCCHASLMVMAAPVRGVVSFDVDGDRLVVRPGQAICIPPGHTYHAGVDLQPRGELLWLIVRCGDSPATDAVGRSIALFAGGGVAVWAAPKDAVADLQRALRIAGEHQDWIADGQLQHVVGSAVLSLARSRWQQRPAAGVVSHPEVARALAWIEAHLWEPVDATGLAAESTLSPSRFYEVFREATGTTPKDYILSRKIELAVARLSVDPRTSVTQLAHALGFSSSQYFATVFRKYRGMSPSQARAQN